MATIRFSQMYLCLRKTMSTPKLGIFWLTTYNSKGLTVSFNALTVGIRREGKVDNFL